MGVIINFTNQWNVLDKNKLYNLASGAPMSPVVESDVLQAETIGKEANAAFVSQRLQGESPVDFFAPLPRKNLLTNGQFSQKVQLKTTKGKIIQYQDHRNLAFVLLVKSQLTKGKCLSTSF